MGSNQYNKLNMPVNAKEIAIKLYLRRPIWFSGTPTVSIKGEEKSFGKIWFTFPHNGKVQDPPVAISIYLYDKTKITNEANEAVKNFSEIIQKWYEERADY